jgi:glutamate-ammonia-ligase adenylyltransferase
MPVSEAVLERLLNQLPERHTPELLFDRLVHGRRSTEQLFERDHGLLSDVLTLAAWSPLLTTTLENNPDYLTWLQRERVDLRVRSCEELGESLARFALLNSRVDRHVMLARFRRRELLRIYLHDIRRNRTIVETTEELSNLADAVLHYALKAARQELDNRYGAPKTTDAHGRISSAEFCIIALGKLGSFELNYSSDIDLLFLFSEDGQTAVGGQRGQISNREYFIRLVEQLLRLVSESTGEGASYRIDVRLRPYGRDGAFAYALNEAVNYYEQTARDWELQTFIRSRAAAGSHDLYVRFAQRIVDQVFRVDMTVERALASVRTAKQAIDQQRARNDRGFNVKLGRGGIREIEFIAQALQIAFGGRDQWLRPPHTLITLGRLADRKLITKEEYAHLSDAYRFLRTLEHRLQMEHGLQTHTVPVDPSRRELVARRMDFSGANALADFEAVLKVHTAQVRAAFDRIFGPNQSPLPPAIRQRPAAAPDTAKTAAQMLTRVAAVPDPATSLDNMVEIIRAEANAALNPQRALSLVTRVAASLVNEGLQRPITEFEIRRLIRLCGVSEPLGEMLARWPSLVHGLSAAANPFDSSSLRRELSMLTIGKETFAADMDALRRCWSRLLLKIGAQDAAAEIFLPQINRLLTELAIAAIDRSLEIARHEAERRNHEFSAEPRLAVLGLGRLGSGGMDYGSDLDMIVVYDSNAPTPIAQLTCEQSYPRLIEFMITVLSSITHEGYLYRVDLRLRPDGQKGPLATASEAFINYIERRAEVWEWLAYVKLRAVAGDLEFGQAIESRVRRVIHKRAHEVDQKRLRLETRRVRDRLEKEKATRVKGGINIKHGPGGMLDVYFATRYLQLRDNVQDDGEDRSTLHNLSCLRDAGSIGEETLCDLQQGYSFLRLVDHQARLIVGRSATLPLPQQAAFSDIARRVGLKTGPELSSELRAHMDRIRRAYDRIMNETD